jgi:hypothetical protein
VSTIPPDFCKGSTRPFTLTKVNGHVEVPVTTPRCVSLVVGDVEHEIGIGMRAKAPSVGPSTTAANGETTDVRGPLTLALFGNLVTRGRDIPQKFSHRHVTSSSSDTTL